MTKHILIAVVGFLVFSITGVAVASAVAHPDVPLKTQAATAVERVTGIDLGVRVHESEDATPESQPESARAAVTRSDDDRAVVFRATTLTMRAMMVTTQKTMMRAGAPAVLHHQVHRQQLV